VEDYGDCGYGASATRHGDDDGGVRLKLEMEWRGSWEE
jgi:hypothetical protein